MQTFSGSSAKLRQVKHLTNENERETAQIDAVRRELEAWAHRWPKDHGIWHRARMLDGGLRRAAKGDDTPAMRENMMRIVQEIDALMRT